MSTSAVYSPHPSSTANLPPQSSDNTATSPITKPTRYPPGRSASSRNGKSVSPTRTAPQPSVSRRSSRRSQSSKSPEKMPPPPTSAGPSSPGSGSINNHHQPRDDHDHHTTATNGHVTDDVDMADNHADGSEGEPELDEMDDDGNGPTHTSNHKVDDRAESDVPSKPPSNKIKLVFNAHKRKGSSDTWEAVPSSRVNTPETAGTPDATIHSAGAVDENARGVVPASSVAAANAPGESRAEAQPPLSDQTLITPSHTHADTATTITTPAAAAAAAADTNNAEAHTDTAAGTATATPNAEASSTPAPDDKPKRAPRKRRKWLRKGEVDPDDPKAVAEQKARHALIDGAIEALDKQEQSILDETHPQLIELWDELTRRRDRLHQYNKAGYDAKSNELARLHRLEMAHHRFQFRADCNDLADKMTFEIARKKARLTAEKVFHDQQDGRPTTKRMYTNMPMLGEGRGCGGWWRAPTSLLSDKTELTSRVVKEGIMRKRRRVDMGPQPASRQDVMDDLIDLGIVEPESSPEPESAEEAEDEVFEVEHVAPAPAPPPPMPMPVREPSPELAPSLPPPPVRSVPPPAATPTPGPPPPMPMPPPPDMYTSPPLPMRPSQSPSASFAPPPLAMPRGPPQPPPRDRGPPPPPLMAAERPKWDDHYYPPRDDEPLHRRPYQPGQPGDRTWYHRPPYPGPGPGPGPSHGHAHGGVPGPAPRGPPTSGPPSGPPNGPPGPGGHPGGPPGGYYYDRPWYPPAPVPMGPPQTATATGPPPPPEPPTATMSGDPYWGRDPNWRMRDPYARPPMSRSQPPGWEMGGSAPAGYATSRP